MDQMRPFFARSRWPTVVGIGLAGLVVVLMLGRACVRRATTKNSPPTQTTGDAKTSPNGTLTVAAAPGATDWQMYQVADPNDARFAYTFGVPPGYRANFREFGYDVEITDANGKTMLTISRYRGKDGNLKISVEGYEIVKQQTFTRGPFTGTHFILKTPPDKFNPVMPVWWLNSPRQEVHMPIPPLGWVVVFSASPDIPEEIFDTFASSLRLPPQ